MINSSRAGQQFRGIFLQARISPDEIAEGTWEIPDGAESNFKLIPCNYQTDSALTHSNPTQKNLPVSFVWLAPSMQSPMNYTI